MEVTDDDAISANHIDVDIPFVGSSHNPCPPAPPVPSCSENSKTGLDDDDKGGMVLFMSPYEFMLVKTNDARVQPLKNQVAIDSVNPSLNCYTRLCEYEVSSESAEENGSGRWLQSLFTLFCFLSFSAYCSTTVSLFAGFIDINIEKRCVT